MICPVLRRQRESQSFCKAWSACPSKASGRLPAFAAFAAFSSSMLRCLAQRRSWCPRSPWRGSRSFQLRQQRKLTAETRHCVQRFRGSASARTRAIRDDGADDRHFDFRAGSALQRRAPHALGIRRRSICSCRRALGGGGPGGPQVDRIKGLAIDIRVASVVDRPGAVEGNDRFPKSRPPSCQSGFDLVLLLRVSASTLA